MNLVYKWIEDKHGEVDYLFKLKDSTGIRKKWYKKNGINQP